MHFSTVSLFTNSAVQGEKDKVLTRIVRRLDPGFTDVAFGGTYLN